MKVKENITLYVCEFCNKKLERKHAMEKHEKWCSKNPANETACSMCQFLKEEPTTIDVGSEDYPIVIRCASFLCTKMNIGVYPHKVVRKGHLEKYPEQYDGQILMPKDCEHFVINLPF